MRIVILVCSALLALGVGVAVFTSDYSPGGLLTLLQSQPLPQKLAWALIIVTPFGLFAAALWESARLDQERKANDVWETRFRGVQKAVEELDDGEIDIDRAAAKLERSDPEDALGSLQRRLLEAERSVHLQHSRNEKEGLLERVDLARQQQQVLRERLGDTIEKRRMIEPLLIELATSQDLIEKSIGGLKADDLNDRLQVLMQSTERMKVRCTDIEQMLATFVRLKSDLDSLKSRVLPLEDSQTGVKSIVNALHDVRDHLSLAIERLDHDGEQTLAERAARFAESKQAFDDRLRGLLEQFSKLDGINKDIRGLFGRLRSEIEGQMMTYERYPQGPAPS
jgi:hypothetical protein